MTVKIKRANDKLFISGLACLSATYVILILAMLWADWSFTSLDHVRDALNNKDIQYSIYLSFVSCALTMLLSIIVAVPTGYILSRYKFPGKRFFDSILDIPIVLPPLVIGLSLLILFNKVDVFGNSIEGWFESFGEGYGITYKVPAIILAQFTVACAFAVRTMRTTFDQISPRQEQVALTLGCSLSQSFWMVTLPAAWRGIITAATLSWTRSLGEFGPILVFAGATRGKTEVLSSTVFLELSIGNIEAAVAVSLLMVTIALVMLFCIRTFDRSNVSGIGL